MGEVVKQLFTSPVANVPVSFSPIRFQVDEDHVKRLDAALNGYQPGAAQGAAVGTFPAASQQNGHGRVVSFRVPSDDEEDEDTDFDFDAAAARAGTFHQNHLQPDYSAAAGFTHNSQQRYHVSSTAPVNANGGRSTSQPGHQGLSSQVTSGSASARHPVEAVLQARTKQLQADALLLAEKQQRRLHEQIDSVEQQLAARLQDVQQQLQRKRAQAAAADEESRKQRSAERSRRLQEVQRQQQALEQAQATALQEVRRAQQEAAAKQQQAEVEARLKKEKEEEERKKREAEAAAAEKAAKAAEEAQAREAAAKQQQQQQQQQAADTAAATSKQPATTVSGDSHLKSTPAALDYEQQLQQKLSEAEAAADELRSKPELKQQRRTLEKQITMAVSQISGTQEQVQAKSRQLVEVLRGCSTPQQQALAALTLANRVISQCDGQVQRIGSFAYPLAYVCVAVGAAVPAFMELLLAKLHQACPLLVPKYTMYSSSQSKKDWFSALGYKTIEDPKTGQPRTENSDEFVGRMSAMVLLYGSIVQTDAPGHTAGLAHGWTWLARCLNALPPTRPTASALMSFLAHAGFRMASVYGRQFHKVMDYITQHYLPALEVKATRDADLRAVGTRLQTFVSTRQYTKEPEGRTLKKVDESSYTRA